MTSRERILREIEASKQDAVPVARPVWHVTKGGLEDFERSLNGIGGKVQLVHNDEELASFIQSLSKGICVNGLEGFHSNIDEYAQKNPSELDEVYAVILKGVLAVAENGAVYVSEEAMKNRLLPIICQELVLVVEERNIVAHMHEAFARLAIRNDGYGVFIAGPSKTADIEQSLVIGAHGPLSLTVLLLIEDEVL